MYYMIEILLQILLKHHHHTRRFGHTSKATVTVVYCLFSFTSMFALYIFTQYGRVFFLKCKYPKMAFAKIEQV